MQNPALTAILGRFWLGAAGAFGAGLLAFRLDVVDPRAPAFQCVTVGLVAAAAFSLVRGGRAGQAAALLAVFALTRLGLVHSEGWLAGLSGIVLGSGIFVVAMIFDLLARRGIVFFKFVVVGPLLGGVYFAVAPLVDFESLVLGSATATLMRSVFLGVVIGDGVGLGVEVADLLRLALSRARAVTQ